MSNHNPSLEKRLFGMGIKQKHIGTAMALGFEINEFIEYLINKVDILEKNITALQKIITDLESKPPYTAPPQLPA